MDIFVILQKTTKCRQIIVEYYPGTASALRQSESLYIRQCRDFMTRSVWGDLEMALVSVDKSTIFRTLCLFAEKHIVHEIEDGSRSTKYCLCHNDHVYGVEELHCHFYCESCNKTFCLVHTHIPIVRYPEGFELRQISYLLKGLCADCRKKRHN